jgi:hypothetical protein
MMADLDKLIDLLEKVKQSDPSFSEKAAKALDVLISDDEVLDPGEEVSPPPQKKEKRKKKTKSRTVAPPTTPPAAIPATTLAATPDPTPSAPPAAVTPPKPKHPPVVPLDDNHTNDVLIGRRHVANMVANLGLLQQNYESDKEKILDKIDELQESLETYVKSLQKIYDLDTNAVYILRLPEKAGEKGAFVKKES